MLLNYCFIKTYLLLFKYSLYIYVGPECESFLIILSLECAKEIKLKCLDFYKTALTEIMKLLPYKDILFEQFSFLETKIAPYNESRNKIKHLSYIVSRIGNIDITQLV